MVANLLLGSLVLHDADGLESSGHLCRVGNAGRAGAGGQLLHLDEDVPLLVDAGLADGEEILVALGADLVDAGQGGLHGLGPGLGQLIGLA